MPCKEIDGKKLARIQAVSCMGYLCAPLREGLGPQEGTFGPRETPPVLGSQEGLGPQGGTFGPREIPPVNLNYFMG